MGRRSVSRFQDPDPLLPPPLPTRLESGIIHWPRDPSSAFPERGSEVGDLIAAHARAIDDGDNLTALRVVRELASIALGESGAEPTAQPALVVGPGTAWFRMNGGDAVDLRRRRASRLVLELLVAQRLARAGEVVPAAALVASGWPGETIRPSSAMSRLYVAILTLRNLGLRDVILAQDGGYLLDPSAEVTRTTL
jgi:hypothetical protein